MHIEMLIRLDMIESTATALKAQAYLLFYFILFYFGHCETV